MNKKIKKLIILIIILLIVPVQSLAAEINLSIQQDLIGICPSGLKALACLYYETDTIYIRSDLNPFMFMFALLHEIGHWLMRDIPHTEQMANNFYYFIYLPFMLEEADIDFFRSIVVPIKINLIKI